MINILGLASGTLFGYGLALSGMISPAKIVGFLDITGNWDPSLAFVMGGALLVTIKGSQVFLKRQSPICGEKFLLPDRRDIDTSLLTGAGLFGVGWGLGGFCPGPAISSLAYGNREVIVFVIAMLAGIVLAKFVKSILKPAAMQA
jgi:uncharacterized membrane protein YedE/YeeE